MKIIDYLAGAFFIAGVLYATYTVGYNAHNETISPYFWIDSNRYHSDSLIECSPIYDDISMEIIGSWIRVSYENTVMHIECLNTDDYEWQDFRDSFIMAFKEGGLK